MCNLKKYPVAISGLALGLASIGVCWNLIFPTIGFVVYIVLLSISLILCLPVWLKIIFYPKSLISGLKDPITITALATLTMLGMIYSDVIAYGSVGLAGVCWAVMVILHLLLLAAFFYFHIFRRKLEEYISAWFVPAVGAGLGCSAITSINYTKVSYAILWIVSVLFIALLFALLLRFVFCKKLQRSKAPTLAVFAAPASICLSGYLTISNNPSVVITLFFASFSLVLVTFVYFCIFSIIIKDKFTPLFSCFTFPLAISTLACFKFSNWVSEYLSISWGCAFYIIALIELTISSIVILYVLGCYIFYYNKLTD